MTTHKTAPGDDCPCGHYLTVTTTRVDRKSGLRVRYLSCRRCGFTPDDNVLVLPLIFAPARPKRTSSASPTSRTELGTLGSTNAADS